MAPPPAIHLRVSMAGERASKLNRRYGQQRSTWEQHRWLLQRWPIHLRVSMAGERASKLNRRYHPDHLNTWVPNLQDIISVAFAVAYIFRIYSEPIRCYYITSLTGVVDFLSIIPVIFLFRQFRRGGHVIRLLQFLRIVRIFSSLDQIGLEGSTVTQQIVFLVASTFGAIFLDAGIIQWIESNAAPPHIKEQCAPQGCLTFWEAFYFLIVTVAEFLFTSFNVILFALDIPLESVESDNTRREVLLHPKGHCIQPDDIGIVMARNIHTVYAISSFEGDTDESNCFGKLLRNRSSKRRKGIDGKEQLQNVSNRWQQIGSVASFRRQTVQGADLYMDGSHPHDVPSSPDGQGKLKSHLKSAICKVVSGIVTCTEKLEDSDHAEFLEFRGAGGEEEDLHRVVEENARLDEHPESLSLENALDEILLWPSSSQYGRPHLAVLDQQRSNILQNLEERTRTIVDLSKPHILVCCQGTWPQNIFYFLNGLRKPKFPNPPIVILHPDQPTATEWGTIGIFKDIFFLKGSPIYELDLMRGGIIQAEKVVILASQGTPVFGYGRGSEESHQKASGVYSSDVDNIIIIANIERILGGGIDKVIVEMHHAVGSHYLWPQFDISKNHVSKKECSRNQDALVQFTPPFMEGRVVCPRMLSFLFHSSFYNRNTVSIVEQLVEGGHVESGKGVSYNHRRVLEQIPVPIKYVNCMYSDLFMDLLTENGMLALGLYRARGTLGSLAAYVFTNPPKNTKVNGADLVFVLI
ncbi:hypothetical protein O6H91_03G117500 [Diphasiastrum complanatum]|uniref:Uncharacterized protein n=1 Tax=Diphasiastrum complanatum TaxID=34168 RepID=A0ACC2EAU7_DIPCM|nr:hypothetical protein O6H91_03G117500 [Diphasiastrum complanatum]